MYLNLCGQAADYVAPVAPKLRSHLDITAIRGEVITVIIVDILARGASARVRLDTMPMTSRLVLHSIAGLWIALVAVPPVIALPASLA